MHRPWSENQFDGAEPVDCPPATRRLTDHYSVKNIELHWSPSRNWHIPGVTVNDLIGRKPIGAPC
jgi:hypothetical protein